MLLLLLLRMVVRWQRISWRYRCWESNEKNHCFPSAPRRMKRDAERWLWEDSHWYQCLPTLDSRRFHDNTENSVISCRICSPVIRLSEFQHLGNLVILQIKVFRMTVKLLKKGNKRLTFGMIILKDPWSRLAPEAEVNAFWDRYWSGLLKSYAIWIKESNLETRVLTSGWGNDIGHAIQLRFWRSVWESFWYWKTLTCGFQDERWE